MVYSKFVYLKEKKRGAKPFYKKHFDRVNETIGIFDEVHGIRLIRFSKPFKEFSTRDRTSGLATLNILQPWRDIEFVDYGAEQIPNVITQEIDMENSNVFCSSGHFYNGFQDGHTDTMMKMEMKAEVARILVDFTSIPNHRNIFSNPPEGFRRVRGKKEVRMLNVEIIEGGIYHLEATNLNKGDVIGIKFKLDWSKIS